MIETLRLCGHLTRRNWTVYRKDFVSNISPSIVDPVLYILTFGIGLGAYINTVQERSYLAFIAPGLAVLTVLYTAFFESSYGFYIRMKYENVFRAMLTTPIGIREILLGEYIWVALKGGAMSIIVSAILACFGLFKTLAWFPSLFLVGAAVAIPCGALGLIACSFVKNVNQFQTVYSFVISPLYFLSGSFFPFESMPVVLRTLAMLFPLAPGVKLAQALFWNEGVAQAWLFHGGSLVLQSFFWGGIAFYRMRNVLRGDG